MAEAEPTNPGVIVWVPSSRWMADSEASSCTQCHNAFSLFVRKHHCRRCGLIFCHKDTSHRWPLSNGSYVEHVRVCDGCYDLLTAQVRYKEFQYKKTKNVNGPTPTQQPSTDNNNNSTNNNMNNNINNNSLVSKESMSDSDGPLLIYKSASICPTCTLLERRGINPVPAVVMSYKKNVFLSFTCDRHGIQNTLVCSNMNFWNHLHSFSPLKPNPSTLDIEDIMDRVNLRKNDSNGKTNGTNNNNNLSMAPMTCEIDLWHDDTFVSDNEVDRNILNLSRLYHESNDRFLLKLNGGLPNKNEIELLNLKIERIVNLTNRTAVEGTLSTANVQGPASKWPVMLSRCPILVDLSFERLVDLCLLPNSVLLKGRVHPAVRFYLTEGEETSFIRDLDILLNAVSTVNDLQLVLLLFFDFPYPNLKTIINKINQHVGLIRVVIISRERSPRDILTKLIKKADEPPVFPSSNGNIINSSDSLPVPNLAQSENIDPYSIIEDIERVTDGRIKPTDFIPVRAFSILSPLLASLGYGNIPCGPSPMCAFLVPIINTPSIKGLPLSRFVDVKKLIGELTPILSKLSLNSQLGLSSARLIKAAIKASTVPGSITIPDPFDYIGSNDGEKSAALNSFARNLQFIVIHNKMDLGSLDLERRCGCAFALPNSNDALNTHFAECTGCI